MYDTHIHSCNSHDSEQTVDMICMSAIEKGLKAVSITDHVDLLVYDDEKNRRTLCGTAECAKYAKRLYGDRLEILTGAEIAMPCIDANKTKQYIDMINADIVLGSVHSFVANKKVISLSRGDLSEEAFSAKELYELIKVYYETMLNVSDKADIDVLCHLTYPLRYTNKKYNRKIDISVFSDVITKILKNLIRRNIALEVNTAKVEDDIADLCPDSDIIRNYYNMGGRLITLGSDAHTPDKIGNSFQTVKKEIKNIGFDNYMYFKNRKPVCVNL